MAKHRRVREELRESMRRQTSAMRDTADEMALMYDGCDDPLHPWILNQWTNWLEFVDLVARPLVEADTDDGDEQAAMALYRKASPMYVCTALVMAANRAAEADRLRAVVEDICHHATPIAEEDGFVAVGYTVTIGALHRGLAVLQGAGGGGQYPAPPAGRDAGSTPADAMTSPRPVADPAEPATGTIAADQPVTPEQWARWGEYVTEVQCRHCGGMGIDPDDPPEDDRTMKGTSKNERMPCSHCGGSGGT